MKYLRKFETEADVNMSVVPNVVLVGDTGRVIYNVLNGVYIQHIDGSLYTTDEWTAGGFANDQANGVVVGEGAVKFVIAKQDISGTKKWSSDTTTQFDGILTTYDSNTAKKDFAGVANTAIIAATDNSGAVYSCVNYTFPNGAKGYLPAAGELALAQSMKSKVSAAMSAIGGTSFADDFYWSSTQASGTDGIRVYMSSGYPTYNSKASAFRVRPFTTL